MELFLRPTLMYDFIRHFNNTSVIRPNNYPTIGEVIPTLFNPSSKEELVAVEVANSLQPDDITIARWIKPPEKWAINQSKAHLTLHLRSRVSANSLIRMGTLIASTRATTRKLLQEAKHCLKCQKFSMSHIAAQCLINDIKLRYLCRNKLPRIILVLMHSDDYVINMSSIRPRVWR